MKKGIYTLLQIIQFILACEGAGYLLSKYTKVSDPMWVGMMICIIVGGIAFYYYHVKDKPEKKDDEPLSLLKEATSQISVRSSIPKQSSEEDQDE